MCASFRSSFLKISQSVLFCILVLLMGVPGAKASLWNFSYVGVVDGVIDPNVYGTGSFTTGNAFGDGYFPVTSIGGTTEGGTITGLVTTGGDVTDPGNGSYLYCCGYDYDNAFSPTGLATGNPFSSTGGILFTVTNGGLSPINLFGDGNGNSYEFSYGEDVANFGIPSYGGTLIEFTAVDPAPEPRFYGALAIGLIGILAVARRYRPEQ